LARGSKSRFWDLSVLGSKSLDKHLLRRFIWVLYGFLRLVNEILDDLHGFLRLEIEILDDLYGFLTLESEILDDLYGFLTLVVGFCTSRTS
jgi:hypothetical protein